MTIIGGLGTGSVMRQILADVMGVELEVTTHPTEVATAGTAILAGIAAGVFKDEHEGYEAFHEVASLTVPDLEAHAAYERLKPTFEAIYQALEPIYPLIDTTS